MPGPIGLLPAAGRGVRFGAGGYPKELFPLPAGEAGRLELRPVAEVALRAMAAAGAERCVVVISPEKGEVARVLGDGRGVGLSLSYVVQPEPVGIPEAVRRARPWLAGADVVFAMPDTVFLPGDVLRRVHEERAASGADVVLGVFSVAEPERLGPVELDGAGRVLRVHDKPGVAPARNTWGLASWSSRFTDFCCAWDEERAAEGRGERVLGHAFEAARVAGLAVRACPLEGAAFADIGTPEGLQAALRLLDRW